MSGQDWKLGDPIPKDADVVEDEDEESLDEHPITLPDGTVLDDAAAEAYGKAVADRAAARRGRPSLTGGGAHSPRISVRLPDEVYGHLELYARLTGVSVSAIARKALLDFDAEIVAAAGETTDEQDAAAKALADAVTAVLSPRRVSHD